MNGPLWSQRHVNGIMQWRYLDEYGNLLALLFQTENGWLAEIASSFPHTEGPWKHIDTAMSAVEELLDHS